MIKPALVITLQLRGTGPIRSQKKTNSLNSTSCSPLRVATLGGPRSTGGPRGCANFESSADAAHGSSQAIHTGGGEVKGQSLVGMNFETTVYSSGGERVGRYISLVG